MRIASRAIFAICCALAVPSLAFAESLSERRAARETVEEVKVEVACGKLDKENCASVLPELAAKTAPRGVALQALESKGSVESVNGLCEGDVNVAIVQADVLAQRVNKADCAGKVAILGGPLYPYQGFMIVRDDAREDKFADMIDGLKAGGVLKVAAGGSGSGGELTLRNMMASRPEWKQRIDLQPDGSATALSKLKDRQIDAFFVMDGPQSPLLTDVRETIDPQSKRRAFKFIDMRPGDKLLTARLNGQALYATAMLESHWFTSTKTVSTPAIIGIREDFYRKQPKAAAAIRQAAEDALPAIAAKVGAKPDWRKDFKGE
jgi:TRAP-type uncharacterized transport system substrate-binding protein